MNTKIVRVDPLHPEASLLEEAAKILAAGGLVIIPTETVYGIAANMLNKKTVERLYKIKQRPEDKPFSLHIDRKEKIEDFARDIPVSAYRLIEKFWPGPLTLLLKSKDKGKVGLRLPDNEIARRVIGFSGVPVVCPSANLSGKPAPVNFSQAIQDLNGLVDFAIDAGETRLKQESSIVDLTLEPPQVLRVGAIKKEDLEKVLKTKVVLFICTGNSCRSVMAQYLLEKKLKEKGRSDVQVLSAGICPISGTGASGEVQEILSREGVDASTHRAQKVTKRMLLDADLILVMEKLHEAAVLEIAPEVKNRLFLLKEFAKIADSDLNIPDPIGGTDELYTHTFLVIKEAIERIVEII